AVVEGDAVPVERKASPDGRQAVLVEGEGDQDENRQVEVGKDKCRRRRNTGKAPERVAATLQHPTLVMPDPAHDGSAAHRASWRAIRAPGARRPELLRRASCALRRTAPGSGCRS